MTIKITSTCPQCGGDGVRSLPDASVQPPVFVDYPCGTCNSTGVIDSGELDAATINDILDKCNDILDKCNDIWEKLNE